MFVRPAVGRGHHEAQEAALTEQRHQRAQALARRLARGLHFERLGLDHGGQTPCITDGIGIDESALDDVF